MAQDLTERLWEHADYTIRTSLYCTGKLLQAGSLDKLSHEDSIAMKKMMLECNLYEWVGHRKSKMFHWGPYTDPVTGKTDGGSDGVTRWLYDHVLKHFDINPSKGLNGDQYRAYFMWLFLTKDWRQALKVMFGYIIRLGMTPSLMEWAPVKPQAYVMLLKVRFPLGINYLWYPLYLIARLAFGIGYKVEMKDVEFKHGTTNKITLLPTAKCLGIIKNPTMQEAALMKRVYDRYFGSTEASQGFFIADSVYKGLLAGV